MNWDVIFQPDTIALYGEGLVTTLKLLLSSLAIGAVLALLGALALVSRSWLLRKTVGAFTYFMRGTPLLIQVYLIYYASRSSNGCRRAGMRSGPGPTSKSHSFARSSPSP